MKASDLASVFPHEGTGVIEVAKARKRKGFSRWRRHHGECQTTKSGKRAMESRTNIRQQMACHTGYKIIRNGEAGLLTKMPENGEVDG